MNNKYFYLTPPKHLPTTLKDIKNCKIPKYITKSLTDASPIDSDRLLLDLSLEVLNKFETYKSKFSFSKIECDTDETKQNRDNDFAFNIIRTIGNGSMENIIIISTYSLVNAYSKMLSNVTKFGSSIHPKYWSILNNAFFMLLNLYTNPNDINFNTFNNCFKSKYDLYFKSVTSSTNKQYDAYDWWIMGHYIFMVLIQGLIVSLNFFQNYIKNNNKILSIYFLQLSTFLMQASESSLRLTGEFSKEKYNSRVRPTLMPPIAEPEMSGLHWRDHQFLIKNNFKNLKNIFASIKEEFFITCVNKFEQALKNTYEAHQFVCQKFVGKGSLSLKSTGSAVSTLEKFKLARLNMLNKK